MKLAFVELIATMYRDQSAVTTVEYALVAALIAVAALVAATQLGQAETNVLNAGKGYFEGGQ
jgi:Flp pilus assembly pilin Flp